jgi:hypothetical protein
MALSQIDSAHDGDDGRCYLPATDGRSAGSTLSEKLAKSWIWLAGVAGLEPATPGFGVKCVTFLLVSFSSAPFRFLLYCAGYALLCVLVCRLAFSRFDPCCVLPVYFFGRVLVAFYPADARTALARISRKLPAPRHFFRRAINEMTSASRIDGRPSRFLF